MKPFHYAQVSHQIMLKIRLKILLFITLTMPLSQLFLSMQDDQTIVKNDNVRLQDDRIALLIAKSKIVSKTSSVNSTDVSVIELCPLLIKE